MKLKQKILLISLIPLLLSTCIIGYNITQLASLKSSTEQIVKDLVKVEELNSTAKSLQKSLSAYSLNISESNKNDIDVDLANMQSLYDALSPTLTKEDQQAISKQLFRKYEEILNETNNALSTQNIAEIKRQSLRTKGMINDVIELKRSITSEYLMMQTDLQTKINGIMSISIILVAVLLIGSILSTFFFTNRIVRPIKQITKSAEEIAKEI
ncbi:hypothetical protein OR571_08610 [Psychrobacillus sp. NEAU-3TGS]|uniref:hypothetical protein n=1 Tax=Psychrobacillus sp. NEAU-3TGS TaxID=2995412 RepID=UPI002496BE7F|nr:hypothetical protein [Psychrobacillus sp. NEAU-3TGS]MDI2587160.1 hypothetical protein [Psychrobacillus sp. NEAU-3TGS]